MRRFGAVLIVAVLVTNSFGCHSDRGTEQTVPAEKTPAPANAPALPNAPSISRVDSLNEGDSRPVIVCFGDSLTAGAGTESAQSYPDYLQHDLDAKGYQYRVVNAGISGNTTKDGLERVGKAVAMKPAIAVVEFGGNDGLRGLRIDDTRANLDKIISALKSGGARVVLAGITLPPDYGPDYIAQFNRTYTLLADKYNVPLLPFLLRGVYGTPGMMQADGIHATSAGNKVVAANVLGLIQPLLKH
jgi:acyl-CoA thioesterase-1